MEDKHIHEKEIAEHDNSHVHKVISDQYRRQKAFGITKKCTYFFIGRMIAFINIIPVRRRKREKGYFRSRSKTGSKQEHTSQYYGDNSRDRRSKYGNTVENAS